MKQYHKLADREENYHDDSDFYAVVYDPETGEVKRVETGTTRGAPGPREFEMVPATEEIREVARLYWRDILLPPVVRRSMERARAKVEVGAVVRIIRGRKGRMGFEGEVTWMGPNPFRTYYRNGYQRPEQNLRVKIVSLDGEEKWADEHAVVRIDVTPVEDQEVRAECERIARQNPRGYETWFAKKSLMVV